MWDETEAMLNGKNKLIVIKSDKSIERGETQKGFMSMGR